MNFGNHVATVVTYEPTGNYNIQRFAGLFTQTNNRGRGFGDMNFSSAYVVGDIRCTTLSWLGGGRALQPEQQSSARHSTSMGTAWATTAICSSWATSWLSRGAGQAVLDAYTDLLLKRGDVEFVRRDRRGRHGAALQPASARRAG